MIGWFLVQLGGHHRDAAIRGYAVLDIEDASLGCGTRWSITGSGYAFRRVGPRGKRRYVYLHRLVLGMDDTDPRAGDHVNGDTLDCRRSNLRIVTSAQNSQNQPSIGKTSRYRGVSYEAGRGQWRAQIMVSGHRRLLGRFPDELAAAHVVREARRELMPFANEDRHPVADQAEDLERHFREHGRDEHVPRDWPIIPVPTGVPA